jgi:hypothetical protein
MLETEKVSNVKRRPDAVAGDPSGSPTRNHESVGRNTKKSEEWASDDSGADVASGGPRTSILLGVAAVALVGAVLIWRARRPTLGAQIRTALRTLGQPKESMTVSLLKRAAVPIVTTVVERAARGTIDRMLEARAHETEAQTNIE